MRKLELSQADYTHLSQLARKVDFFAPLTVGQLDKLLPRILLYQYGKGEKVFRQGDIGDAFYILYDGSVGVAVKKSLLSLTKEVAVLKAGDFFGEMALISRDPRNATVACREPSRLFVLLREEFQYLLKENPSFADEVRAAAARRKFDSTRA